MRGLIRCNVLRSTRLRTRWICIPLDTLKALGATKLGCALFVLSPSPAVEKAPNFS